MRQRGLDRSRLCQARFALEQIERRVCRGARERVGHERGPVHQRGAWLVRPERLEHRARGERRGKSCGAAGQRLGDAQDVGRDVGLLAGKHRSGSTKPGEDLIGDQQNAVTSHRCRDLRQLFGCVESHPAGALYQRLDDDRGDLMRMRGQERIERSELVWRVWQFREDLRRQVGAQRGMHSGVGVAQRHRPHGVAVISIAKRKKACPSRNAAIEPVLHRHLHGDLDRNGAEVAEEDMVEGAGCQRRQSRRERFRRRMGEAAEHDVRHRLQLLLHGRLDVWVIVSVAGRPPRGDAVDQHAAIGQVDTGAFGAHRLERRCRRLHLRVGSPDRVICHWTK